MSCPEEGTKAPARFLFRVGLMAILYLALTAVLVEASPPALAASAWNPDRAWRWYDGRPWLVGCNFVPSSAVNDIEMWQAATYDPKTIDRELALAQGLGFNTVRVFVNFVVWQADPAGMKKRLGDFLGIAARHGISVMIVLLDDCNFAGGVAKVGPQPAPVPGVSNGKWFSSPPLAMVTNRAAWPALERYVRDMVATFGRDPRVAIWDIYNESGNSGLGDKSLPLCEAAFGWARAESPQQPLTACVWNCFEAPMAQRIMALSDVVSFHDYDPSEQFLRVLATCQKSGKPVLCSEWLRRSHGNTFTALLPILREKRVGCYNWGLVAGRIQTYMLWESKPGDPEPKVWQHDIFRHDGTPFDPKETAFIQSVTRPNP